VETGPPSTPAIQGPTDVAPAPTSPLAQPTTPAPFDDNPGFGPGTVDATLPAATEASADRTGLVPEPVGEAQVASPLSQHRPVRVDTSSIYIILVFGAGVALAGGSVSDWWG
jgi:hypothetical protein